MKKTELKEIIRKEVRNNLKESEELHNYFYGGSEGEPKAKGLNKFRDKKYEIGYIFGEDKEGDTIIVYAPSDERALELAKSRTPRTSFGFKILYINDEKV